MDMKAHSPQDISVGNAADILLRAAAGHPNSGIYFVPSDATASAEFVTYPALLQEALRILGGLQARVRDNGTKIVLVLERPRDFITAFWACVLGGYSPVPLAPVKSDNERWTRHLAHVDGLLDQPLFVSTARLIQELPLPGWSAALESLNTGTSAAHPHQGPRLGTAILMLTSGSTGNSKAVVLSHRNLLASMTGRAVRQRLTSADVMLNWVAYDHVAALLESHMVAVHVGATHVNVEPSTILVDPLCFLRIIDAYRISVAFAPNFLLGQINSALQEHDILAKGGAPAPDLSCLRHIVTGGEANVVDTGRRFLNLLAPYNLSPRALWPAFGMTETCAACIYSEEFPDADVSREFASVGTPIDGVDIRIVNEEGMVVPDGVPGELQLRGAVIFSRYHNNNDATQASFTHDGWFRSGDVGRIDAGRLILTARSKDSIIVSGVNYFSQELEVQLERLKGIDPSFVAAFPTRSFGVDTEQLVVAFAAALPKDDERGLHELIVAVRNTTVMLWGFRPTVILPLPRDAFPKTSLGKIQRALMRKRFEAGEYGESVNHVEHLIRQQSESYVPPSGDLEMSLTRVFSEVLGIRLAEVSATASFFDLGGTSLEILKLTRTLGTRFGLKTTLPTVLQDQSVRRMAARISSADGGGLGEYDPIVPLQTTGSKPPLFLIHPGNGEILVLVNLAKYFRNDRPLYALRARGFDNGERCFGSVEEIVTTYVGAIRRRQSRGPYFIAGYSLGCRIAFEIAKKLEGAGEQLAFLGCIDFIPCYDATGVTFSMAAGLALVLDLISWERYEEINSQIYPVPPPGVDPCEYVLRFASPQRMAEIDLDAQRFRTWARVAQETEQLLLTHLTTGKVKAMTVFCSGGMALAEPLTEDLRANWRSELLRWREFVDNLKLVDVAGSHHSLMGPQHVASFQAVLRNEIEAFPTLHYEAPRSSFEERNFAA